MTEDVGADVELGTQLGDQLDGETADALALPSPSATDESLDKRIVDENVRALKAANAYRRVLVRWTLRAVGFLTAMATVFMALYMCSEWDSIDSGVMIAYFASVVAETIGILYVIARYLFPSGGPRQ